MRAEAAVEVEKYMRADHLFTDPTVAVLSTRPERTFVSRKTRLFSLKFSERMRRLSLSLSLSLCLSCIFRVGQTWTASAASTRRRPSWCGAIRTWSRLAARCNVFHSTRHEQETRAFHTRRKEGERALHRRVRSGPEVPSALSSRPLSLSRALSLSLSQKKVALSQTEIRSFFLRARVAEIRRTSPPKTREWRWRPCPALRPREWRQRRRGPRTSRCAARGPASNGLILDLGNVGF